MPDFETVILAIDALRAEVGGKMMTPLQRSRAMTLSAKAVSLPADAAVITSFVRLGDPQVLQSYLSHPDIAPQCASKISRQVWSAEFASAHRQAFKSGHVDVLEALQKAGIGTKFLSEKTALISSPGAESSLAWLLDHSDIHVVFHEILDMVDQCGSNVPDAYAEPLAKALEDRRLLISSQILRECLLRNKQKLFAVLVRSGPCLSALQATARGEFPANQHHCRQWLTWSLSNHGRFEILRHAPSLASMVAQPDWNLKV